MGKALEIAAKYGPRAVKWVKDNWWWLSTLVIEAIERIIKALFN